MDNLGKSNVVADFFLRLTTVGEQDLVKDNFLDEQLFAISTNKPWFADMENYLTIGNFPPSFTNKQMKKLIKTSAQFKWLNEMLFKCGPNLVLHRFVREDEIFGILRACHNEPSGGKFLVKRTSHKILSTGYYWPYLYKDVKRYIKRCDPYQRMGQPTFTNEMPLQPQVVIEPFEIWGLDFVGLFSPPSQGKEYILVCTNYVTKWEELHALTNTIEEALADFLWHKIMMNFWAPRSIVSYQGPQFMSNMIQAFTMHYHINHRNSSPYHPQSNG